MTNKRKIQILKKVIKRFEKIIPKFKKNQYAYEGLSVEAWGICDSIYFVFLYPDKHSFCELGYDSLYGFEQWTKETFKIRMPKGKDGNYRWPLTAKGYQARINACKKAIERLSK